MLLFPKSSTMNSYRRRAAVLIHGTLPSSLLVVSIDLACPTSIAGSRAGTEVQGVFGTVKPCKVTMISDAQAIPTSSKKGRYIC